MNIELNDVLITILIGLVSWIGNRMNNKIDALEKTVTDMAVKNERDHGDVMTKIAVIEKHINIHNP